MLPSINQDFTCARQHCTPIPSTYSCDPGTWERRDPARPYQFDWHAALSGSRNKPIGRSHWHTEASRPTYYARTRLAGIDTPTGTYRCVVTASNAAGSASAASRPKTLEVGPPLPPGVKLPTLFSILVTGIEVTQAVQESHCGGCLGTLPSRNQSNPTKSPGRASYPTEEQGGVPMAAGKFTVVRVYAHVTSGTLSGTTAQLEVLDSNGNRISTLSPDTSPAQLTVSNCSGVCVNASERANPGSSFNFLVPWQETYHRFLGFRATVTAPPGPNAQGQCLGCRGNVFALSSVPFLPTATVPIHPIPLTVSDGAANCGSSLANGCTNQTVQQVFGDTQTVLPEPLQLFPYDAPLNVAGMTACKAPPRSASAGRTTTSARAITGSACSPGARARSRTAARWAATRSSTTERRPPSRTTGP